MRLLARRNRGIVGQVAAAIDGSYMISMSSIIIVQIGRGSLFNIAFTGHRDQLPEGVQDGILTAKEISQLDLRDTDLVVLSACETGRGEITSEGVFGLQRAFKMAGVQTLVMSLWKVDDNATSLMMQTFYEHLLSGMSKREAFNLAQAAVRAKYSEPYYWAGFVMLD